MYRYARLFPIVAAIFACFFVLGEAHGVAAQVVISEIMYDLEGADSGREWIEAHNTSGNTVDLADWRLFEGGTNHTLTTVSGSSVVAAGGYAVIADSAEKFLADWPGFTGVLFDSSFSLKNDGELLELRTGDLVPRDTVTYTNSWGAAGDGNSLQKSGGSWIAARPTPGHANSVSAEEPIGGNTQEDTSGSTATESENTTSATSDASGSAGVTNNNPVNLDVFITDAPEVAVVGAATRFAAIANGLKGEPLTTARFIWNFGDGATTEGAAVLHSFVQPGSYIVQVSAASGKYTGAATQRIEAVPARVGVETVVLGADGYIRIANTSAHTLNLSGWYLALGGGEVFMFPVGTLIARNGGVNFAAQVTGLIVPTVDTRVVLLYPNGERAAEYADKNALFTETFGTPELAVAFAEPAPIVQAEIAKDASPQPVRTTSPARVVHAITPQPVNTPAAGNALYNHPVVVRVGEEKSDTEYVADENVASAGASGVAGGGTALPWIVATVVLIAAGGASMFFGKQKMESTIVMEEISADTPLRAQDFEIREL